MAYVFVFIILFYMNEWPFSFICSVMLSYMNGIAILSIIVIFIIGM